MRGFTLPSGPVTLILAIRHGTGAAATPAASLAASWKVPVLLFSGRIPLASNHVLWSAELSKLPAASAVPLPNGEPSAVKVSGGSP